MVRFDEYYNVKIRHTVALKGQWIRPIIAAGAITVVESAVYKRCRGLD